MPGSSSLYFATSNDHKYRECKVVLEEFAISLKRLPGKGPELQADDLATIAAFAATGAYARYKVPLLAEDAGLFVDALGGFPGPYSAYASGTIGCAGILALLAGKPSRKAVFRSAVAFCDALSPPKVFEGSLRGGISLRQAGHRGFGFDPIFIPRGSGLTLGQVSLTEKSRISHRAEALRAFGRWFKSPAGGQRLSAET